jgi:hypothetical protein
MELMSSVGDPDVDVHVQERFDHVPTAFDDGQVFSPSNPFEWNGQDGTIWKSGETLFSVANHPGYSCQSKFTDRLGFFDFFLASASGRPLSGGIAVLTFTHHYFAATIDTTNGAPGVAVGTYEAKCYTDQATHTQVGQ